jgi:hypothetical protein
MPALSRAPLNSKLFNNGLILGVAEFAGGRDFGAADPAVKSVMAPFDG